MTMNLPVRPDAASQQPAVQTFQLDASSVGNVARSVNLFRGDVNIPLTLMQLPGRDGLAITLTAFYASNVSQAAAAWNATAPTGVLGLGWSLSPDRIFVDGKATGDPLDGTYYLQTGGTVDRLLWIGEDAGGVVFQSRVNPLWQIHYDRRREGWRVVREDGTRYLYGGSESGDRNAVMHGVRWNNWIGASRVTTPAPARYAVAWNLARLESPWGSGIDYVYENDDVEVAAGMAYTRASYVVEIRDMLRRRVRLHYGDKDSFEYVPPHVSSDGRPEPAYQDRYETRYLRSIDVLAIDSATEVEAEIETSIVLAYDFIDATGQGSELFKKRVLCSVTQYDRGQQALPAMMFDYDRDPGAANPGALSRIVCPEGGRIDYAYSLLELNQDTDNDIFRKNITVPSPLPQSRPTVLHGPGYVVIAWYAELRATTQIDVYSFSGRWSSPWSFTVKGRIQLEDSRAVVAETYFALYLAPADSVSTVKLRLFERVPYQLGNWRVRELSVDSARPIVGAETALVSGDGFVVLHLGGDPAVHRWTYDPIQETWREDIHLQGGTSRIALGAARDFYIAGYYSDSARAMAYQIFSREPSGAWRRGPLGPHGEPFPWEPAYASRLWAVGEAFAVATYFREGASEPRLRMLVWDAGFVVAQDLVRDGGSFGTEVHGSTVGSGRFLYRYDGAKWQALELHATIGAPHYAYGDDVAIVSRIAGSGHHSTLATFDASRSAWQVTSITSEVAEDAGAAALDQVYAPTISGDVLTVGSEIRRRAPDGTWPVIGALPAGGAKASLQNRAPEYLGVQDQPLDPRAITTTMLILENGRVATTATFPRQQLAPADGSAGPPSFAGPRVLVTYPAGESIESPTRLYLHRLLNHAVSDRQFDSVASAVRIDSGYEVTATTFAYDAALAVFDGSGEVVQYPRVVESPRTVAGGPAGGSTEHAFYNGLAGGLVALAPPGIALAATNADDYYSLLAGLVRMIRVRDADGLDVSITAHEWKGQRLETGPGSPLGVLVPAVQAKLVRTTQIDAGLSLFALPLALIDDLDRGVLPESARAVFAARGLPLDEGATVAPDVPGVAWEIVDAVRRFPVRRAADSLSVYGSVLRSVDHDYDPDSGLLVARRSTVWSADARDEVIEDTTGYAWRVPAYAGMVAARMLTAVAGQRQVNITRATTVSAIAVTYRADWGTGAAWAQEAFWSWRGGTALAPEFPYGSGDRAAWIRTEATLARNAQGQPLVGATAEGPLQAMLYDTSGYNLVASFQDVDRAAGPPAADYCGFESYEDMARWSQQGGGSIRALVTDSDSHTGACSLGLPGGPAAPIAVTHLQLPAGAGTQVWSAWVKTPPDFPAGVAGVRIGLASTAEVTELVPIVDTGGTWQQIWRFVEPGQSSAGPVSVTIAMFNDGPATVLIDDVRFGPARGEFAAQVYDARTLRRSASIAQDGATLRYIEDRAGQLIATIGPDEQVTALIGRHYSRALPGAAPDAPRAFDPERPNTEWTITAAAGGFHEDLRTAAWQVRWQAEHPAHWAARDGALVHVAPTLDTLSLRDSSQLRWFGVRFELRAPSLVTAPLGVLVGDSCSVRWSPGDREWQLIGRAGAIVARHAAAGPDGALVLCALPRAVLVYLDGAQILSQFFDEEVGGTLALFTADEGVSFASIFVFHHPRVTARYLDGVNRPRQDQAQGEDAAVVTATVYDPLARPSITTKAMAYHRELLGYRPAFVTSMDWDTGVMTGDLAAYYAGGERSNDEGYPYQRRRETASPLPAVVELGAPGAVLAIRPGNLRTTRLEYGAKVNDGFLDELPACEYYVDRAIDADGNVEQTIRDKAGRIVGQRRTPGDGSPEICASYRYDARGALSAGRPPNFHRPPSGVDPAAFLVTQRSDVFDHLLEARDSNTGTTEYVYSDAGLLRFTLRANGRRGAGGDRIIYQCYDVLGRPIETGIVDATWDRAELDRRANTSWPLGSDGWRYRYAYDGDGRSIHGLGRLVRVAVRRGPDQAALTQELDYDASGNVVRMRAQAGDDAAYEVGYGYNVAGEVVAIAYPEAGGLKDGGAVVYRHDALGQIASIGSASQGDAVFATYAYTADGAIERETLNPRGPAPIVRRYRYNSPNWPTRIEAAPFTETLAYWEQTGFDDARYYTGAIARITNEFGGAAADDGLRPFAWLNAYDGTGRLRTAQNTLDERYSVGASKHPMRYDANGNVLDYGDGTVVRTYRYQPGTDRVDAIDGSGAYEYDRAGNTVVVAPPHGAQLVYDEASGLVTKVAPATGGASMIEYGVGDRRRAKRWTGGDGRGYERQYLFGPVGGPLIERTRIDGGAARDVRYIYGATGSILAMVSDEGTGFVVPDHLGSTRLVLDRDGALWGGYSYRPLGDLMGAPVGARPDAMRYLFTGQELDHELSLYNYKARLYDPRIGRFLSPDPARQFWSPYLYAGDDPLNAIDPSGELAFLAALAIAALVGAVVGAAAGGAGYAIQTAAAGREFDWGEFGVSVGIGAAAGLVGGAVGFGAGAVVSVGAVALGYTASSVAVGVVAGAVGGAAGGVTGQVVGNAVAGRPLDEGLLQAAVVGGVLGAVTGGVGARFAGGTARGGAAPNTATMQGRAAQAIQSPGTRGYVRYRDLMKLVPRGTPDTWAPSPTIRTGYKYQFTDPQARNWTIRMHSPDTNAPLGSNARLGWTARIERSGINPTGSARPSLLAQDARFATPFSNNNYNNLINRVNDTHIPLRFF